MGGMKDNKSRASCLSKEGSGEKVRGGGVMRRDGRQGGGDGGDECPGILYADRGGFEASSL